MPNKSACAANAHVKKEDACAETNMYLSEGRSANLGTIRSADGTITMQILSDDNAKPTVETADINSHIFRNMNLSAKNKKKVNEQFRVKCRQVSSVRTAQVLFVWPIRSCSKTFTQKSYLTQHTNGMHFKRKSFQCSKCPLEFHSRYNLKGHLSNKHGKGKTFSCYMCKTPMSSIKALERHMNSLHAARKRFMCPIRSCSKIFTRIDTLKRHTITLHSKNIACQCNSNLHMSC